MNSPLASFKCAFTASLPVLNLLDSLLTSFECACTASWQVLNVLEKLLVQFYKCSKSILLVLTCFHIYSDGLIFVNALFECLIHVLGNTVQYCRAFLVLKQYKTEVKMSFSTTQYSASKRPLDFKSSYLAPHD